MNPCPETIRVESWLDEELDVESARAMERHVGECPRCAAERTTLLALYGSLRQRRIVGPGPALTERILDRVVPSRIRRRQVALVGWSYTAVSAVTTFSFMSWITRPESQRWLVSLASDAMGALMDAGLFAIGAVAASAARLQHGLGLIEILGGWLIPVARAIRLLAADPVIAAPLWAAVAAAVLLLLWMRPRSTHIARGDRHVGILAF